MSWTNFSTTKPVARKRYRCSLCYGIIRKGQQHVAARGADEDGPATIRMHNECSSYSANFDQDDFENGWDTAEFLEEVIDHIDESARTFKEFIERRLDLNLTSSIPHPVPIRFIQDMAQARNYEEEEDAETIGKT